MRQYNKDTTYIPVYDLVHTNKEVNIGQEDLEANMKRVVAGLKVIVKTKNNAVINSNITDMQVLIGGIAEKSICIQPNPKIRQRLSSLIWYVLSIIPK